MKEYDQEQLWELYEQLPEDLQKAVFSKEIGNRVRGFCYKNGVRDEETNIAVLKMLCYLFLGLMTPAEFRDSLKKDLKMDESNADNLFAEINNNIFMDLKESLENLYGVKLKIEKQVPVVIKEEIKNKESDRYRELLE